MQWCVIFLTMCSRLDISIFCIFCNALAYTARMTRCNWHRCWIKVLCKIWWPRLRVSGVTSLPLSTHRCRPKCSSSRWAWTTRGTVRHWLPWKQCHRANQSTWPAAWRHQLCPAEASTSGQSPTRWPAAANQRAAVPRYDQSLTLTVYVPPRSHFDRVKVIREMMRPWRFATIVSSVLQCHTFPLFFVTRWNPCSKAWHVAVYCHYFQADHKANYMFTRMFKARQFVKCSARHCSSIHEIPFQTTSFAYGMFLQVSINKYENK